MLVETFEVQKEVNADGQTQPDAECMALIEQLGLTGQHQLIHRDEKGGDKICPYRKMTADEMAVYAILCDQKTELRTYADEAIPLRILQVAAHARDFFQYLEVWHPRNADVKDPVLIGRKGQFMGEVFILARWGKVLDSFEVLKAQATKIYREKCLSEMKRIKSELEADIARVQSDETLLSANIPQYFFNA